MLWLPICLALVLLLLLLRLRKEQLPLPGVLEYWVFVEGEALPSEHLLLRKLLQKGAVDGSNPLVFTHVGMHLAIVSRQKNPHLFHPDLYEDEIVSDQTLPIAAAKAPAMVIIRFLTHAPATDPGYLTYLPHLAEIIGEHLRAIAVYDLGQKRLFSLPEFTKNIGSGKEASRCDAHVRVQWSSVPFLHAETIGMQKEGLPNLETGPMDSDERLLVVNLLREAASTVWKDHKLPESLVVDYFGSKFKIIFKAIRGGSEGKKALVTLMRVEDK